MLTLRSIKDEIISLCAVFISSILMLIENITVFNNEGLSLFLCTAAFLFAVFRFSVRGISALMEKRITKDFVCSIIVFSVFLAGFYQNSILSALIFELFNVIIQTASNKTFISRTSGYIRILENAKERVGLSDININDSIFILKGKIIPFDCKDQLKNQEYKALDIAENDLLVTVTEKSLIYAKVNKDNSFLDRLRKILSFVLIGEFLILSIISMIIGVKTNGVDSVLYSIFAMLLCFPFDLIWIKLTIKKADTIYVSAVFAMFFILMILMFFSVFSLWILMIISCVLSLLAHIYLNFTTNF